MTPAPNFADYVEINHVTISGKVDGKAKLRRPGDNRFPILTFVVRTEELVGEKKRPEEFRWRAKCFGRVAEEVAAKLAEGVWIIASGRLSGYVRPPHKGETRMTEINVKELRIFPYPSTKFSFDLQDGGDVAVEPEEPTAPNFGG
jgi:single-stranded DNA-binding protein